MLRVVAHKSAAAARQYYAEGLKREDYYSEGQEIVGKWQGKAAAKLGLSGNVKPAEFSALVDNQHPGSGKRLTPHNKKDRIVGYDLNFHAPKSLSVLYALTGDKELLKAFRSAVADTMEGIEAQAATRVRKRGAAENRTTGNLAWAEFIHLTARPVGGIPDPHLHIHCFTFNATFDGEERQWKAAKFREIKKEAPYHQAVFHSRLTAELAKQGYAIERTRTGWEIKGMPPTVLVKFSRRTAQIERLAHEKGITDAKAKDALGASSRAGKRHGLTYSDLLAAWSVRLTDDEKVRISKVCYDKNQKPGKRITAAEALDFASAKLFENNSVVPQNRLLAEAMRYGVGHTTPESIRAAFERRGMITRQIGEETLCTSLDVLAEEVALINFVRSGRSTLPPLLEHSKAVPHFSREQQLAMRHILESRDQVIAVRGGAGVGKTTLMQEVVPAIEATGKKVFAFAPSADASRKTLREAGFANANTLAHLLANPELQAKTRGGVIWIDEAGLVGVRDFWRIREIVGSETKIILTGDIKQHSPVPRGDTFRLLQEHAGMRVVEVTQIRRQERAEYKEAVAALAKGDLRTAFRRLDKMGAFVEIENEGVRYRQLADDYLMLGRGGRPPLVISPTHAEAGKVTEAIRTAKREAGFLGVEREFLQYHNLQWSEAERGLPENYQPGLVVQFHQKVKGIGRGELFHITGQDKQGRVELAGAGGKKAFLPLTQAARFQVFEERKIKLAKGDLIRATRNEETADGRRIYNGAIFGIERITKKGELVLTTGGTLKPDHGHIALGYCSTSFASQSKSVRDVLIAQSEQSFIASSSNQFYVSASRAKESIHIYTDGKRGLQEAVGISSSRMAGVELAGFSKEELSSFMSEMGASQWKDALQSRRASAEAKTFAEKVLRGGRQSAIDKADNGNWEKYIAMRRAVVNTGGKSRSKGYPHLGKKRIGGLAHSEPVKGKFKVPNEAKKPEMKPSQAKSKNPPATRSSRTERIRSHLKSASEHFRKIMARSDKGREPKAPAQNRPLKIGNITIKNWQTHAKKNVQRVVNNVARRRKIEAAKQVQKTVKVQAPPTPRRGK